MTGIKRMLAFIAASGMACGAVLAQGFPDKPIRIVVPYPPGGATDLINRIAGEEASTLLGQSVIVENRTGAGGLVGTAYVAKSPADGYMLAACTVGTCAITSQLLKSVGYDLWKDFAPVINYGGVQNVFLVHPSVPAKRIADLVAIARSQPGKFVFGSGGIGNSPHMTVELLLYRTKVSMLHGPYKGSGQALVDLMGGQIPMMVENEPSIISHVRAGRVRAIAVTGPQRSSQLTGVPTMIEQGYADFIVEAWFGLMVPAKTPRAAVDKLNATFNTVLQNPRIRKRLEEVNLNIAGGTPEQFGAHMKAEYEKWGKVIAANNIKVE